MAKAIMLQGTMSSVGKSLLTAALCRIFRQDGYRAVPFKSQNMALNSFVTSEGLEIGRAQAMQAQAAGVEPSVLMNPILLKPTTDMGSQVILNGKVYGNMKAGEYFRNKKSFVPHIMQAYSKLESMYDIVVIEGAGSPVELNLKSDDIVNMGMARLAKAPVLLVGDIDRGGVFAQLLGTLSLLEKDERDMVKGLIVNKFRGDKSLFESGADILTARGGKPIAGIVPYIECDIDDEDSLSDRLNGRVGKAAVNISVIRLPKISNYTDFDVFSQYDDVSVRFVTKPSELDGSDMIILPGTKSTVSDMRWLRESGMEKMLLSQHSSGTPIFGVCGGYQLLGKSISDPLCLESGGEIAAMGLLDTHTVFAEEKRLERVSGTINCGSGFFSVLNGLQFHGYEIHMGRTLTYGESLTVLSDGSHDGSYRGNVGGCYAHGFFDDAQVSGEIVKALFARKGMEYHGAFIDRRAYKEKQYDILADSVRNNIDMELVCKILKEGL